MQEWNAWFLREQKKHGTIEEFARKSGLDVRSIAAYRVDRIPRKDARAKIAAVLGDEGPLPEVGKQAAASFKEQIADLNDRLEQVEATLDEMRERELLLLSAEAEVRHLADEVRTHQASAAATGTQ